MVEASPESREVPEQGVVDPGETDVTVALAFYDETMDGVEGVSMPDPPEADE